MVSALLFVGSLCGLSAVGAMNVSGGCGRTSTLLGVDQQTTAAVASP